MEQQKEIWKDIAGFENYQVSNFGRVKSKKGLPDAILVSVFVKSEY